jgi:hypothetical protein
VAREIAREGTRDALRRARWRLRGAWLGPTFAALALVETVTMHLLPLDGGKTPIVGALLISVFLQLVVVAVLAPLSGLLLRRLRPDLPAEIARDRAGTSWLVVLFAVLLAIGITSSGG